MKNQTVAVTESELRRWLENAVVTWSSELVDKNYTVEHEESFNEESFSWGWVFATLKNGDHSVRVVWQYMYSNSDSESEIDLEDDHDHFFGADGTEFGIKFEDGEVCEKTAQNQIRGYAYWNLQRGAFDVIKR
jgi:hypothetical protein